MRSYGNAGTAPKNAEAAATAKEILKSAEAAKDTPAEKIPAEEISGQIINFSAMPDKIHLLLKVSGAKITKPAPGSGAGFWYMQQSFLPAVNVAVSGRKSFVR